MKTTDFITPAMTKAFRRANACRKALAWLEERPRTLGDLIEERPDWALWSHGKEIVSLTAEQADACAKKRPDSALVYAANLLSPERLDKCAKAWPGLALNYAAHLLTPKRRDWCAKRHPSMAIAYAARLLTPERLDWCAKQRPYIAIAYAECLLTPRRRAACLKTLYGKGETSNEEL